MCVYVYVYIYYLQKIFKHRFMNCVYKNYILILCKPTNSCIDYWISSYYYAVKSNFIHSSHQGFTTMFNFRNYTLGMPFFFSQSSCIHSLFLAKNIKFWLINPQNTFLIFYSPIIMSSNSLKSFPLISTPKKKKKKHIFSGNYPRDRNCVNGP